MRIPKKSRLFRIVIVYENNMTRTVEVKASSREVAEARALKRNRGAVGIKRPT
jgi:hypothetical protein